MKVCLLEKDDDFNFDAAVSKPMEAVWEDLELEKMLQTMAADDAFLAESGKAVLCGGRKKKEEICYRQAVLQDCMKFPADFRALYQLAVAGMEYHEESYLSMFQHSAYLMLEGSIADLHDFLPILDAMYHMAQRMTPLMQSSGWQRFFDMLEETVPPAYTAEMEDLLQSLHFPRGILVKTHLDITLKGASYILCEQNSKQESAFYVWVMHFFRRKKEHCIYIDPRDESGSRILGELHDQGLRSLAHTVVAVRDAIRSFFTALRKELAFYIGCLNLENRLQEWGISYAFPVPREEPDILSACGLCNISLALRTQGRVIANAITAEKKPLILITGANQGGKTTFLRAVGQAQLMMNSGMFIAGTEFQSSAGGVFTHFKREEDRALHSGKFDEELKRMSDVTACLRPGDLLLMNESFAATNEREGTTIAMDFIDGCLASTLRILFVTHFYTLANSYYERDGAASVLFLRAEREADGRRPYVIAVGRPLETSYGEDIYQRKFGVIL